MDRSLLKNLLRKYSTDIDNGDFKKLIVEVYLQYGSQGLSELKKIFEEAKIDMHSYNKSIAEIIGILVANSDLGNI